MRTSNVGTPIAGDNGTIFVALELSQRSWLVTVHSPDKDRFSRHKLAGGDDIGLLRLIERICLRAEHSLGRAIRVVSCYEAGYDGFWLHRRLVAAGITNFVFDPASIAVDRRARRVKTDRIDGELLLRTLMSHWRGDPRVVRIVQVPTPEQEDARRMTRERERLIKEQTAHTNRIKALLRLCGLAAGNPRRRDWVTWLNAQRDRNGDALGVHMMAELAREHARLMLVGEQLRALSQATDAAPVSAGAAEMARRGAVLQRLKGVGPVFAATLANEVFYKDFHNRREVAGYCGLAPSPWRSGRTDREQGISKAGNPRARHKAIELAWLWLEHQPESALSRWFRERTAQGKGRIKRIAIVALARKLMVALWRFLTTGLVPEQAVLKTAA